jgi:hypothetical protein
MNAEYYHSHTINAPPPHTHTLPQARPGGYRADCPYLNSQLHRSSPSSSSAAAACAARTLSSSAFSAIFWHAGSRPTAPVSGSRYALSAPVQSSNAKWRWSASCCTRCTTNSSVLRRKQAQRTDRAQTDLTEAPFAAPCAAAQEGNRVKNLLPSACCCTQSAMPSTHHNPACQVRSPEASPLTVRPAWSRPWAPPRSAAWQRTPWWC